MPRRQLVLSLVAVTGCTLLAAGCGGGGSPRVANVASPTTTSLTTTPQNDLLAFSRCMRSNGVPGFPDPQHFAGGNVKLTIHQYGVGSPRFRAAFGACNHLLPNGGPQETAQQDRARLADELSFARCMRSHGVSRFPDPTAQGQLTVEMVQAQGIDVHSAAVLRVVQACLPASHGALTPTKVREAIAGAGR
jgi:hypothetical protein